MSTITVTNIKATGETASRAVSGVAAAWCNVNGSGTIAIRDSQNVSSVTDNGIGDISYIFSNSMANANYVIVVSGGQDNSQGMARYSEATGSWRTYCYNEFSRDAFDGTVQSSAIFGDLS